MAAVPLDASPLDAVVDVPELCPPPEPYSYAVRAGDTLYLAGQVALDPDGAVVGATVAEQTLQVGACFEAAASVSARRPPIRAASTARATPTG